MVQLLVTGIMVLIVSGLLQINARSQAQSANGVHWVKYGAALKAVGAVGIVMPFYVVTDCLIMGRPYTALILGFVFTMLGLPLFLLAYFWRVGYDAIGIHCISPWRKNRFVPWSNVTDVSFSQIMKQWIVHAGQLGTIRINILVPGSSQLIDVIERRGITVGRPKYEAW
jgi:hypothetical protein